MRAARGIAALVAVCAALSAHAEPAYVVETLVVNVNSAPDGSGDRVASIRSGDKVELIERQGDQSHVRLSSGSEGWVKSTYLTADPPMRQRLEERTAELDKSRKRVEQLENELSQAQAKLVAAAQAPQATPPPERESRPLPLPESPGPPARAPDSDASAARPAWRWVVLGSVISLIFGFALGWNTLDRRIRRKYGGLRIW